MIAALRKVWAVLDAPAGKRLAPFLREIVDRLIACGELDISDRTRHRLIRMFAATIDRRLAGDRAPLATTGPLRDHARQPAHVADPDPDVGGAGRRPAGFVEIDLVGHESGNPAGEFAQTLTVTDIATGWTENRAVHTKAQKWVLPALREIVESFPFPVRGINSDNGKEFINAHLLAYCQVHEITFTRSRPGNKNGGAHVEQKTGRWCVKRWATTATPQTSRSTSSTGSTPTDQLRHPATETGLQNPPRRQDHQTPRPGVDPVPTDLRRPDRGHCGQAELHRQYLTLNPAAIRREIIALSDALIQEVLHNLPAQPHQGLSVAGIVL